MVWHGGKKGSAAPENGIYGIILLHPINTVRNQKVSKLHDLYHLDDYNMRKNSVRLCLILLKKTPNTGRDCKSKLKYGTTQHMS